MTTEARIERAATRRQANWLNGADPLKSETLTRELFGLYAELRLERAREEHGIDPVEIRRRARIERELERLMSDDAQRH